MSEQFFNNPILNSPYEDPKRHWEIVNGQPTENVLDGRRSAKFFTPIPKPRRGSKGAASTQESFVFDEGKELSTQEQQYDAATIVSEIRSNVDRWRTLPNPRDWGVTAETARLLQYWRSHQFSHIRPFFCQVEAVETIIWLTEVAPNFGRAGRRILNYLDSASSNANPELVRLALKMATGAGKTTVMAMIIAWQTVNAVRHPTSRRFTRGFLVVAPGIPIRDRLRVLLPNDPDNYYTTRELVPHDMRRDIESAKIVVTNYHAFKLRDNVDLRKGGRELLQGRGPALDTQETEGQMIRRVMPELSGMKNVLVINDEGHHCYREKPGDAEEGALSSEDKREAKKNSEAARLWISGLEAVKRNIGVRQVLDLSATPFFLRGSGYAEGTLFPWTVSDFSLMDAIECGIVKLPRVPVADNIPGAEVPIFREIWKHIRTEMPKAGRGKAKNLDPLSLPLKLQTALEALYGNYEQTFEMWQEADIPVPPCFIIVCNNTSTSKLVYDYISGFERENENGSPTIEHGRLPLFRNFDESGNRLAVPRTLLIDSEQLESGDALDINFRKMAATEIEQFRREIIQRTGDSRRADNISDQDLLREVMNTVGKEGRIGESIRCVVSVSMLTEGWDASTVTHILGVRAFGTQLLCEQVVGRALRRQSYDLNENGLFDVEYADVLGVPFDFTANPVVVKPVRPRRTTNVRAVRPERDELEIRYPRVLGYRVELPNERLSAEFTDDSTLELTPDLIGPTRTRNEGIIGEGIDLSLAHTKDIRHSTLVYHLTSHLLATKWRADGRNIDYHLFGQMKRIVNQWLREYLVCKGGAYPTQLLYREIGDMACERITAAITRAHQNSNPIRAMLDPFNPTGSTAYVNFNTSRDTLWRTDSRKCHLNYVVYESGWEAEFCRVAEAHPAVLSYVKNYNLGLEAPYRIGSNPRTYIPDFILRINDGRAEDPLNLIVEVKGYRREDAKVKRSTMETYWIPGVNHLKTYGRWAFAEFTDAYMMEANLEAKLDEDFSALVDRLATDARHSTMADLMRGYVGIVDSSEFGQEAGSLSTDTGRQFADALMEDYLKKQAR